MLPPAEPSDELAALRRLGPVSPPPPGVLDAARETLWAAVAAEMLAADPQHPQASPGAQAQRSPDTHAQREIPRQHPRPPGTEIPPPAQRRPPDPADPQP